MSAGGFFNHMREVTDQRTIEKTPLQGWVTNNVDPMGLQRIQVRVHVLHDDIADEDLPWFSPNQLSAYSGSANIGDHGPIPQKGAKIWISFNDRSQYHGVYGGGVTTTSNIIPEFAKSNSTPTTLPGGTQYNFGSNYPSSNGGVDGSGSINASDEKTDTIADIHVSATGRAVDGKGNVSEVINGDVNTGNSNASKLFPTGYNLAVFGNWTVFVSGNVSIAARGNTTIQTNGNTTIESVGPLSVLSNGEIDVMSDGGPVNVSSTVKVALQAPSITSSVPIVTAAGKTPTSVSSVAAQTAPTPRQRPNPQLTPNDETY